MMYEINNNDCTFIDETVLVLNNSQLKNFLTIENVVYIITLLILYLTKTKIKLLIN